MHSIINENGLAEIREWLQSVANDPAHYDTDRALHAWAEKAEESMVAGNGPHIELAARHAIMGVPLTFTVSDAGVTHAERFVIQQHVSYSGQYEPMEEGGFDTAEAAVAGMRDVARTSGFTRMRVWDELEYEVVASSEDGG